jgi:hypothetical protein
MLLNAFLPAPVSLIVTSTGADSTAALEVFASAAVFGAVAAHA